MSATQFIPVERNRRLQLFSQIMQAAQQEMSPPEAHRAMIGAMRQNFTTFCYVEISSLGLQQGQFRVTRVWREDDTEAVPDRSPWQIASVPIRKGGVISEILERAACLIEDLTFSPDDPMFPELADYHSLQATPGGIGEQDNWVFVLNRRTDAFNVEGLENLVLRVGLMGSSLKNLETLRELRRANAFIDAELNRIASIQRSLLPPGAPAAPGLDVAAYSETFDRAGGDLYDYAEMRDGRWVFIVADASGHGPSAAVVAAMLNAILHAFPSQKRQGDAQLGPAEVLVYANHQLSGRQIENSFVTAFLAFWDSEDKTLTYARAGHNPPMLLRKNGELSELKSVGSLPLAIMVDTTFDQHTVTLTSGDLVLMYTDGIIDARGPSGEAFGEERLAETLRSATGSAADVLSTVQSAVADHMQRCRLCDDQTVLILRVK